MKKLNKLFYKIGARIAKTPIKILLIFVLIFAIMISGAIRVNMATGNETLVNNENDVYILNHKMEENFGGDAIMVLFEGEGDRLFNVDNLEKMWNVEQRLHYNESIFSFMSPGSLIHQMADRQSIEIKKQVKTISEGLEEMSTKLVEIGEELESKELKDPSEIQGKLDNLSDITGVFNKLISGQDNLGAGVTELKGGLINLNQGLDQISSQLNGMANQFENNPEMKMKLNTIAENISKSSQGLLTMAEKTSFIKEGSENTSKALTNISSQLKSETSEMKEGLSGGIAPDELKTMANGFITMGENLDKLSEGLETFHDKAGMMTANFPHNQKELDNILYDESGELRSMFSDVILDEANALMMIKLVGNLNDEDKDKLYEEVSIALDKENFDDISYMVSGKPVLDSSLRSEMQSNMKYMVLFAVILMFIILMLVFKVRWRVLGLGIIFVSVLATLGFMGYIGVPMTMVSMAVFPILIGLGIDYSIQFQNRYEEEKSTSKSLGQIGKAVGIAVLATVLGFISLYASPVPMIQDFGKMLTIGVIISFIGSIFLLMPILKSRDLLEEKSEIKFKLIDDKPTIIDRILQSTTKFIARHSLTVIVISIVLAAFGLFGDSKVGVETDIETFMPQDMDALSDIHYIRDKVGSTNQILIYMEEDNLLSEDNLAWMRDTISNIEKDFPDEIENIKSIDDLIAKFSDVEDLSHEEYM